MIEELRRRHGAAPFADKRFDQTDAVAQYEWRRRNAVPRPAFEHHIPHTSVESGQVVVGRCNGGDDGATVHAVDPGPDIAGFQHAEHVLQIEEPRQRMSAISVPIPAKNNESFQEDMSVI